MLRLWQKAVDEWNALGHFGRWKSPRRQDLADILKIMDDIYSDEFYKECKDFEKTEGYFEKDLFELFKEEVQNQKKPFVDEISSHTVESLARDKCCKYYGLS